MAITDFYRTTTRLGMIGKEPYFRIRVLIQSSGHEYDQNPRCRCLGSW